MNILAINAYHANASAALLQDGKLVAAVEEERFNRVKYAAGFPTQAVRYCLSEAGLDIGNVHFIVVPRNPWARIGKKLLFAARMPKFAVERAKVMLRFAGMHYQLAESLGVAPERIRARFHRVEHHHAHLASAFFVSPFDQAALLSADGLGDFASTMWGVGRDSKMEVKGEVAFPHSLGMFYTALTQYLGFWKFGDEYKVMGLSAFGQPSHREEFQRMVTAGPGIGFRLGLRYFNHQTEGTEMTWRSAKESPVLGRLFSPYLEERLGPSRAAEQPLEQAHKDIAASQQAALEEVLFAMLNALHRQTKLKNLCLAGGVAFNCVANGKISRRTPFENIWVQPAAGDAGLAVGAAFYLHHQILSYPRQFAMEHAYWGPGFQEEHLRQAIQDKGIPESGYRIRRLEEPELAAETASYLADGAIVGWFQGRMEWGPRALGNRSILADPRRPEMKDILNQRIKHRESFRPFAPSILEESAAEYFDTSGPSPFMQMAVPVRPGMRDRIPAPTHIDGTGRLQTVSRSANPRFWALIEEFRRQTGVPVLLNTSFNENEPIVCLPGEALDCFLRTQMDVLVLGEFLIDKPRELPRSLAE
ncbi:MAG TPA: carbamoyltransferase C-terminal domain-containing protein [Candidatus Acidoferrales bacterium]|nr:carbamoyltransferase C-terminal domain-containing protein [Candidatus Acidoferrales bacterium]